jgi:hypothetical protein
VTVLRRERDQLARRIVARVSSEFAPYAPVMSHVDLSM